MRILRAQGEEQETGGRKQTAGGSAEFGLRIADCEIQGQRGKRKGLRVLDLGLCALGLEREMLYDIFPLVLAAARNDQLKIIDPSAQRQAARDDRTIADFGLRIADFQSAGEKTITAPAIVWP